jgi:CBS domain-containing protein
MEPGLDAHGVEIGRSARVPDTSGGPYRDILRVTDIMSKDVVTATLDDTIFSVAQKMAELRVSCVVITDQEQVVGILTDKDMLHCVALRDVEFRRLKVAQRMSSPVDTIQADISVFEADRLMDARCIRRLPVLENGRLVGIVTQTDITRGLISLNALRYVSDIMSRRIVSVSGDAIVVEAARLMSTADISCLVVMHQQEVTGIITEKDLLKRVVALHRDPTQTRVADVMSCPVVSVPSGWSILSASKKMETLHFHRLLVMDDKTVCGIITQTDIMRAIRGAFDAVESQRRAMEAELSDVVQRVILDMQRMRGVLQDLPGSSAQDNATPSALPPTDESLVSGPVSLL